MADTTNAQAGNTANLTDAMHYLSEALIQNGVKNMYGVVGIPVTDFARVAQGEDIRYIGMRHEEDAGNAAMIEGFLTGKPGVYLTVSAPGFLNGLAPLLEATQNGYPTIMIGGSSTRNLVDMGEGDYEGLDQYNYAKDFAKAAFRVDDIHDIPLAVARAMHVAMSGRPGGVYIDFPGATMGQTMDKDEALANLWTATRPKAPMPPCDCCVTEALELLASAKNPLIVVGKGAAMAQAEDELKAFVEATDIPYQPMSMAKGLIPDTDPHCTASARGLALRTADVVMLVGARLNWMLNFGKGKEWNPNVKFIQLDIDAEEIENSRKIDCPVVGDIKITLKKMNKALAEHPVKASQEWLDMIKADTEKNDARFAPEETADTVPMKHMNALGAIKKVYDKNPDLYLVNEGANTLDDCRDVIDIYKPRHRLDCGTWGVMGCGTGYAIGAAVTTGEKVLYIGGDSAFGFSGMEVETACRFNLPITFVVLNNGGIYRGDFENISQDPAIKNDPSPLTLSYDAHYEKMIEAFGGKGYYATTPAEVEQMVGEAVASGKPSFVHVQLAQYAGVESGHIGNLNPYPVVGPLSTSECTEFPYPEKHKKTAAKATTTSRSSLPETGLSQEADNRTDK